MDKEKWNETEARRASKFGEIMQVISERLGADADLELEAEEAIERWEEGPEMNVRGPIALVTPLNTLLREYHEICEQLLDIQDADQNAQHQPN
jgi:hypothetical protein